MILASNETSFVSYAYDHQGRMVWKEIKHRDAEAWSREEEKATSYLWDGYNIIAETVADSATYHPAWDANGNIMEYVSTDGIIAAHREYDPFGNTGVYTDQSTITNQQSEITFTHWFSTKPWCVVTDHS